MKGLLSKRILAVVLSVLSMLMLLPTFSLAASDDIEGVLEFRLSKTVKDGYSVKAVSSDISGDLVIPSEYNGLPVTEIGVGAFKDCYDLKNVVIPNSVKRIMSEAFYGCLSLSTVIPESVIEVGEDAFKSTPYYDNNWEDDALYIDNVLINVNYFGDPCDYIIKDGTRLIANKAFSGNWGLLSITFPSSLTHIGSKAFENCAELKDINFNDELEYIGDNAFFSCSKLETLSLGKNIEYIGGNSFGDCEMLSEFTIPESVTVISTGAFRNTAYYNNSSNWKNGVLYKDNCLIGVDSAALPKNYTIKEGTRVLVDSAFFFCSSLEGVVIPKSVTRICDLAFSNCGNLKSVNIPDSITYIGAQAFFDCTKLEALTVLDSVEYIGSNAFTRTAKNMVVYGYKNSAAETAANECKVAFSPIGSLLSDDETGITVSGRFSENAKLKVDANLKENGMEYCVSVENAGDDVGKMSLRIPFNDNEQSESLVLYRANEEGEFFAESTSVAGRYIVLNTNELGRYLLSNERFFTTYGDVNGDGKLSPSDVVLLRRYFANFNSETGTSSVAIFPGADANGNGDITPSDVVLLRRYFANFDSKTGESTIELGK